MLTLKIALRYLVARKSHNAVNVIAWVAVVGVAVAGAAMTVVLSVFNGFSDVAAAHMSQLDPELLVERADGRVITHADALGGRLGAVKEIAMAMPTLSERGLAMYDGQQTAVVFKGVGEDYDGLTAIDSTIIDGVYAPATDAGDPAAQISVGVANALVARPGAENVMNLYVPRRQGRINPANPAAAFRGTALAISGVYQVGQPDLDNDRITIPIDEARMLLGYDGSEATAIELSLKPGADVPKVKKEIEKIAGKDYRVLDRLEQRGEAFRMIEIEKWVTFMMLIFVLAIALFNIISTLSLLIIEKRSNMATLRALGAPMSMVRRIFSTEAWLITAAGGIVGIILGVLVSLVQQYFHLIKLNADANLLTVDAYPVRVSAADTLIVLAVVLATGFLTSLIARLQIRKDTFHDANCSVQ